MNYIIVDDNETDRLLFEAFAEMYPGLHLQGSYAHPLDAVSAIMNYKPDLLFLDIEMPVMNGIDFLRSLKDPPLCIFVTSHPDFAVEAFELYALDFIVKPVTEERFESAIARAKSFFEIKQKALKYEHFVKQDMVIVQEGYNTYRVMLSDIIYLEALKDYTRIFTKGKSYVILGNLGRTLDSLRVPHLKRVHRSYAVNTRYIDSIIENNISVYDKMIPVGKTYRSIVNEMIKTN